MSTCNRCNGLIAEPGKAYSYSGKFCHCGWATPPQAGTPNDSVSVEEYLKQREERIKGYVKKPALSHILNLCEQLSPTEVKALIGVLNTMHDNAVLASKPEGFVPNAPSPYDNVRDC